MTSKSKRTPASVQADMAMIAPPAVPNAVGVAQLSETPPTGLQAPTPSGVESVFKPSDSGKSYAAQLAEYMGRNDVATTEISKTSAFTADGLERKNQEGIRAFISGPVFPTGHSSGGGATTLQPFVNAFFNRERLNAGTPVRPELGAPYLRGIGNAFGDRVNASNWAAMAQIQTGTATVDPAGFAQVNHNGTMIADRASTYTPERGANPGGPLSGIGAGGPNAGAVFDATDGSAGGAVGFQTLQSQQARGGLQAFSFVPPSGVGALATPQAYGLRSLLPA